MILCLNEPVSAIVESRRKRRRRWKEEEEDEEEGEEKTGGGRGRGIRRGGRGDEEREG